MPSFAQKVGSSQKFLRLTLKLTQALYVGSERLQYVVDIFPEC